MDLTDILRVEAVRTLSATGSKKRLFHELGDVAKLVYDIARCRLVRPGRPARQRDSTPTA